MVVRRVMTIVVVKNDGEKGDGGGGSLWRGRWWLTEVSNLRGTTETVRFEGEGGDDGGGWVLPAN